MKSFTLPSIITSTISCLVLSSVASAGVPLELEPVANFNSPIFLTHAPGDDSRLFVVERDGYIRIVENGVVLPDPFLDIDLQVSTLFEGGFLGLAFHPNYAENGFFYVHYTRPGLISVVARYAVSENPNLANPLSSRTLLSLTQPAANHNGGYIGFGPNDGYLYIAFGDGGGGGGQQRSQDITNQWHGKVLRIDVDGDDFPDDPARNYAIPADNPFVGVTGDDEIWALGLRNPFRCSFDRLTGDFYIGDVGQGSWEEIDFQPASSSGGENYGWGCMEGNVCQGGFCVCNSPALTLPIQVYSHGLGCSVSGGTVYRGCAIPDLDGTYFYGDFCTGRVWSFRYDGGNLSDFTDRTSQIGTGGVVAFGEDADGELYLVSLNGSVSRLVSQTPPPDDNNNGIPDTCETDEPCVADITGDGTVDVQDLTALILAWGSSDPDADLTGDGEVNVQDLTELILGWGDC